MGYWLKRFSDGNCIMGDDDLVTRGMASWSRSRLDGMVGVELCHNLFCLDIAGAGEYWQSDTYEADMATGKSVMIKRRIQKKIDAADRYISILQGPSLLSLYIVGAPSLKHGSIVEVLPEWHGQWVIAELDLRTQQAKYYIRSDRL